MRKKILYLLSACFFVTLTGIFSDIHLGDEILHFRLARTIFHSGFWPLFDPLNQSFDNQKLFYIDPMLWHTFLAFIWKLFFGVSKITAQIYQTAYLAVLVISVYIFSKKLYNDRTAVFTALLLITTPGILLLSVIFHTDMPAIALAALAVALISRENFLWAGIITGLCFLTKRTSLIFIPGFLVFLIYFLKGSLREKFFKSISFLLPAAIFCYLGQKHYSAVLGLLNSSINNSALLMHCPDINFYLKDMFDLKNNLLVLPAFLGISTIASFCLYLFCRAFSKKDLVLWTALGSFLMVYFIFFTKNISLRYSMILVPLLCLIAAKGIATLKSKIFRRVIIIISIIQFFSTLGFILIQRRVTKQERDVYTYIKSNTKPDSRFMCTRPDLQLYTGRKTIWNNYLSLKELPCLFWSANDAQIKIILDKYGIDYLLVEKDRIYNDSLQKHQLGWPKSFVGKIPGINCFELEFENNRISLWKIKK